MDWQPNGTSAPAALLTRQEVADSPLLAGAGVTPTRLKMWEYRNVLPKAIRRSHHRKVQAVYPPWAPLVIAKLVELQRLGVPTAQIRPSLHQYAQALLAQAPELAETNAVVIPPSLHTALAALVAVYEAATGEKVIGYKVELTVHGPGYTATRTPVFQPIPDSRVPEADPLPERTPISPNNERHS
jgi:hypothetical protein